MIKRPSLALSVGRSGLRKILIISLDLILLGGALLFSFAIRFDMSISAEWETHLLYYGSFSLAVRIASFWWFRLYDISFRFVSLRDLWYLAKASLVSSVLNVSWGMFAIPVLITTGPMHTSRVPMSILALDVAFTILLAGALRVSKRIYLDLILPRKAGSSAPRTLVVGAGQAADQLLRHLYRSNSREFNIVGLLDDDPTKSGVMMQGVSVIGRVDQLGVLIPTVGAEIVLIALPSAGVDLLRRVYADAQKGGARQVKVLSSELISGKKQFEIGVKDIREIKIEDLLGRESVKIDNEEISTCLSGARVMITGASGSIGAEIVRQVTRYHPEAVAVVDMDETGLFNLEHSLVKMRSDENIDVVPQVYLMDIRNKERLRDLFDSFRPNVVFHAAAYKHVPMMELHPEEAVATNIVGTFELAKMADEFGVDRFIFVSTDKSVNPRNVMGATKRVAGMICCGLQKSSKTRFISVRFGNVLGSRGSVIPLFLDQLRNGGPLTVTHPEMVRYFMTIPEAVSLVLESGAIGHGGEVFVLDMGQPVKIMTLAEEVIRMHGKEPHVDIEIQITGLRPGEKMYEELLTAEEGTTSTEYEKLFIASLSEEDSKYTPEEIVAPFRQLLKIPLTEGRHDLIVEALQKWVPSYRPNRDGNTL